jgi:hypothetical protein
MTILCGAIAAVGLGRSWPLDTFLTALLGFSFRRGPVRSCSSG